MNFHAMLYLIQYFQNFTTMCHQYIRSLMRFFFFYALWKPACTSYPISIWLTIFWSVCQSHVASGSFVDHTTLDPFLLKPAFVLCFLQFCSVQSLSHESQHTRPPCPSPTPRVHPNSCALSQWCHPAISSSVIPFSSCPKSLPASESFPMSQLFTSGGQSIEVSASASVLPMNTQNWSSLGWTGSKLERNTLRLYIVTLLI